MTSKMIPPLLLILCLTILFIRYLFAEWQYRNKDKMQRYQDAPRVHYSQQNIKNGKTKKSAATAGNTRGRR